MITKDLIAVMTIGGCFILLPISWLLGKDGTITTAVFGLLGLTAGTMIGFKFGEKQQ